MSCSLLYNDDRLWHSSLDNDFAYMFLCCLFDACPCVQCIDVMPKYRIKVLKRKKKYDQF